MLERERHRMILRLVTERSIISVGDLVALLGASEASIRRDINALAERGEINRVRGGAEAVRPRYEAHLVGMPFALSRQIAVPEKRAIARAACELIEPTDSIIISGGTTTHRLIEYLADRELDILTNSFAIAAELITKSRNRITLPGGTIFREQGLILSPYADNTIKNFRATKLFTGCYGISRFGIMQTDPLIVHSDIELIDRSESVIVLADSRKLRQRSPMIVAQLNRVSTLITDSGARAEDLEALRSEGLKIILAQVTEREEDQPQS